MQREIILIGSEKSKCNAGLSKHVPADRGMFVVHLWNACYWVRKNRKTDFFEQVNFETETARH